MSGLLELTRDQKIACFSMEICVHNDIATYSGGLGGLAGDSVRSAADLMLPLVAVTLLTKKGFFNQDIALPDGRGCSRTLQCYTPPPPSTL